MKVSQINLQTLNFSLHSTIVHVNGDTEKQIYICKVGTLISLLLTFVHPSPSVLLSSELFFFICFGTQWP